VWRCIFACHVGVNTDYIIINIYFETLLMTLQTGNLIKAAGFRCGIWHAWPREAVARLCGNVCGGKHAAADANASEVVGTFSQGATRVLGATIKNTFCFAPHKRDPLYNTG